MRLMLGTNDNLSLLVNIHQEYGPTHFDFWVVNGAWYGTYTNGHITVWDPPTGSWSKLDIAEILCDNQDRLQGDYQEVFNNFHNPDYVAPRREPVVFHDMDDDIPF
jgi:hypothetical protein